jgi:hypothetical protein
MIEGPWGRERTGPVTTPLVSPESTLLSSARLSTVSGGVPGGLRELVEVFIPFSEGIGNIMDIELALRGNSM